MYINFLKNHVCRLVKTITMHTNLFAKHSKLHKFAATKSNFKQDVRNPLILAFVMFKQSL